MRINFLLPHYGYRPTGGFKVVYIYANAFAKLGNEVSIIYPAACKTGIRNLAGFWRTWRGKKYKSEWFRLEPEIKQIYVCTLNPKNIPDADVTIATAYETAVFLNIYSLRKGKKVYFIQGLEIWAGSRKQILETWQYDMTKIVISQYLLDVGKKNAVSNLFYVPNAIDKKIYRVCVDFNDREKCIGMMYSPAECKGSRYGIEALLEIKKQITDITAVVFGKEERPSDLPQWIEYYENPDQTYIVEKIYNRVSVFICSSICEGWGLPPMEAMACGAAVVTTDCGGVRDFAVPDETAIVCPVKDMEAIKNAVIMLLEDEGLRHYLVQNAMRKIEEFDWNKSIQRFLKIITD